MTENDVIWSIIIWRNNEIIRQLANAMVVALEGGKPDRIKIVCATYEII
jgi:hypothetical protein